MKSTQRTRTQPSSGFTLIEVLVVIAIIGILAGLSIPALGVARKKGMLTDSLSNAKQVSTTLAMYAYDNDGCYPWYEAGGTTVLTDSNKALEQLMPRYSSSKKIFQNPRSAWCAAAGTTPASAANNHRLLAGEDNDWSYVVGLSNTSNPRWPLLATALADNSGNYSTDTSAKGGVWGGTDAIVVFVDNSVKRFTNLKTIGTTSTLYQPDDPARKMFETSPGWLDAPATAPVPPTVLNPL